ncbi:MAG TPA: hypothetical protein VGR77_06010 [Candidatus Dormibacteraeota bacterium]|nr:hypothetical protein [Candidatus Dormibacteraeota bacterium]
MSGPAPETEGERRLRELAGRFLAYPSPEGPTTAELLLDELPSDAPPDLVVPEGLDLVGSLARRRAGQITGIEVMLDGTKAIRDFLPEYERVLKVGGWRRFDRLHRGPGGFDSGWHMGPTAVFVHEVAESALFVAARELDSGRTEVGLRYDRENAANMMTDMPGPEPPGWDMLPDLRPPRGVKLQAQGSSGGGGRWTSEARAQTEMPVPELEAHLAEQLAAAGWTRIAGAADDTTGWSSWTVPKPGNWRGLLLVLAAFSGWRWLSVRVETFPRGGSGGWSPSVSTLTRL